jgi:hypothetical protein
LPQAPVVRFSPTGQFVLTVDQYQRIKIGDLITGKVPWNVRISDPQGGYTDVGDSAVAGNEGGILVAHDKRRRWMSMNLENRKVGPELTFAVDLRATATTPDGQYCIQGLSSGRVVLIDLQGERWNSSGGDSDIRVIGRGRPLVDSR